MSTYSLTARAAVGLALLLGAALGAQAQQATVKGGRTSVVRRTEGRRWVALVRGLPEAGPS